nr:cold-shock protein [Salimicrobium halophilum]
MAFGRQNQEKAPEEETSIWECTAEDCNCWMRDNFKDKEEHTCPMCNSEMKRSTKVLQVVENKSLYYNQ